MVPVKNLSTLILAAGFGTRLGELTKSIPKPLIEVGHARLIELTLWHIKNAGISEVTINLHYLGKLIADYLGDGTKYGLKIFYSWEDPILDTGGAIKKVLKDKVGNSILVINSDTVLEKTFGLKNFIAEFEHDQEQPIAKMLLVPAPTPNPFSSVKTTLTNKGLRIAQIGQASIQLDPSSKIEEFVFAGVHLFNQRIWNDLNTFGDIFCSIKDLYPRLLLRSEKISAEVFKGFWNDSGTPERLAAARKDFSQDLLGHF